MSINNNIFIILIIFIIITKITKENDQLKKERILWTLKEVFNSIENDIMEDYSLSLYYLKYKIQFSDFKLNNPIDKEISITEIIPTQYYSVNNVSFYINYNNYILFDDKNNNLAYGDLPNIIKITFTDILFSEDDNYLYVSESSVDSIMVPKIQKISNFRFFKDYNEGKVKPFYPDTNEYCRIEEALSLYLKNMFLDRIDRVLQYNTNLYLYDFYQIMGMSKNISYKGTKLDYLKNLDYVYINEYYLYKGDYTVYFNKLYIYYLELNGFFVFDNGDLVEFNAYLKYNDYITLDERLGIDFYNKRHSFEIELLDPDLSDVLYQYETVFHKKYREFLENNSLLYFKNLEN